MSYLQDTLLIGELGGQTVIGGTNTGDSLTLHNNSVDDQGIIVEDDGTVSTNVTSYEALVTDANDIPNKKYVDDAIVVASGLDSTIAFKYAVLLS